MQKFRFSLAIATVSIVIGCFQLFFSLYPQATVAQSQLNTYKPVPLGNGQVVDVLSDKDIPTGQKGFAKDYTIETQVGDRLEISLSSSSFDTVVSLLDPKNGDIVAENDDGEPKGTDSLLFVKISKAGKYVVRVQSFGGSSGGKFTLNVTKLRPVQ